MEGKNYICKCRVLRINKEGQCQVPSNILSIFYESLNILKKTKKPKKKQTPGLPFDQTRLFGGTPSDFNMIIALLLIGHLERVTTPHQLQVQYLEKGQFNTKLLIYDHDKLEILKVTAGGL